MKSNAVIRNTIDCKVRILHLLPDVFEEYQPIPGNIYDAKYRISQANKQGVIYYAPICVIKIRDKSICLRPGEYEIVEEEHG